LSENRGKGIWDESQSPSNGKKELKRRRCSRHKRSMNKKKVAGRKGFFKEQKNKC